MSSTVYVLHGSVAFEFGRVISVHSTERDAVDAANGFDNSEEHFDALAIVACQLDPPANADTTIVRKFEFNDEDRPIEWQC